MPILPTWLSRQSKTSGYLLAAIVVLGLGMLFVAAAPSLASTDDQQQELEPGVVDGLQTNNIPINVSFESTNSLPGHSPGAPQTYEVVIENATEGIEGYDFTLEITNNPSVFSFESVNETNVIEGEYNLSNTSIIDNGNAINFETALANNTFNGSDRIVIAEVGVTANATQAPTNYPDPNRTVTEAWGLSITSGPAVQDLNHSAYTIDTINLQSPPVYWIDVNDDGVPATDATGDGRLESVRGGPFQRVFDVGALFRNLGTPVLDDNTPFFKFNPQVVDVSVFDVGALFRKQV